MSEWLATTFVMASLGAFTLATMWSGFSLPLFFVTFGVAMLFIFVAPRAGLLATIILTMFFAHAFTLQPFIWGEHVYKIYPLDFLLLITAAAALVHLLAGKTRWSLRSWLDALVFLFIGVVDIFFLVGYFGEYGDQTLVISALKNYAFYALLYFLVVLLASPSPLRRGEGEVAGRDAVIRAFCTGGVLLLFFIIAGVVRGEGYWTEITPLSTSGRRFLASTHAYYLTIPFIFLFTRLLARKIEHHFETGLLLLVQLFGIASSLMRHIWIALLAGLVFLFVMLPREARSVFRQYMKHMIGVGIIGVTLLLLVTLVLPFSRFGTVLPNMIRPFTERATSIFSGTDDVSIGWRIDVWKAIGASFIEHPFTGIGFGRNIIFDRENYQLNVDVREIHNSPLAILVQMGLLGFIPFILMLVFAFRAWWRAYRRDGTDNRFWALGIGVSMIVFLIAASFQPYLETNTTAIFFWILLGMMRTTAAETLNSKS